MPLSTSLAWASASDEAAWAVAAAGAAAARGAGDMKTRSKAAREEAASSAGEGGMRLITGCGFSWEPNAAKKSVLATSRTESASWML